MFLSSFFFDMPAELMTAIATVLGFAFMGDLTANQQNSLGNFLMLAAQIMITNATQQQLLQGQGYAASQADHEARLKRLEEAMGLSPSQENNDHSSSVD